MSDACSCCPGFEGFFDDRRADGDLRRYRRRGARKTTRWLVEALEREGVAGSSLLDVGGGVGVVAHELVARGANRTVAVDASRSFLAANQDEARRRGYADRGRYEFGDFAKIADRLEAADIVTLDRVVCCYRDMEGLVGHAARKGRRLVGLVYPRDTLLSRIGQWFENVMLRIARSAFRGYVHAPSKVHALLLANGFELRHHQWTLIWRVDVYRRAGA